MKDLLHPSLLQINYLMTLEKIEKKRGCVGTVADICGVSHGPVSRFFKECVNYGYLTEQYTKSPNELRLFQHGKVHASVPTC